jgi:platelet-activating factor acetylhydrolase IB subunit alpha
VLTERQQQELNRAVIQYLEPILHQHHPDMVLKLQQILDTTVDDDVIPNYLEKKWSTVLRLQKKIIDLQNELSNIRTIVDSQYSNNSDGLVLSKDKINWLPYNSTKTFPTLSSQVINTVVLHPVLPNVLAGCSDGSLISWNLASDDTAMPEKYIKAHTRPVNKLCWSWCPVDIGGVKTHVVASCSADLSIKIWNGSNYTNVRTLTGHEHTVSSIAFSRTKPDILYSVSRDKNVKVWDIVNGYCIKSFIGHSDWVRDIDVISINSKLSLRTIEKSNLGDFLVTCSNDHSIRLSHGESGTGLALLIGHSHVIETVKFLPLTSNVWLDKYLTEYLGLYPTIPQELVDYSGYTDTLGYKYCISGGRDNTVKIWLLPPPVLIPHRYPLPAKINNSQGWLLADLTEHTSWVKSISIHPNGRFIFTGSDDKTIKIWDLSSLNVTGKVKCVRTLRGNEGFVNSVEFASFNLEITEKKDDETSKKPGVCQEEHDEIMKRIEAKMRCLFVSGGSDNSVKLWS